MVDFTDNIAVGLVTIVHSPRPFARPFFVDYVVRSSGIAENVGTTNKCSRQTRLFHKRAFKHFRVCSTETDITEQHDSISDLPRRVKPYPHPLRFTRCEFGEVRPCLISRYAKIVVCQIRVLP